jgi:hypothetical protein
MHSCNYYNTNHFNGNTTFQMEPTQLETIDRVSVCLQTPVPTPIAFIKPRQNIPWMKYGNVNIHCWLALCWIYRPYWHYCWCPQVETSYVDWPNWVCFAWRRRHKSVCEKSFSIKDRRWIISRIVIVILIYHRHKHIDLITYSCFLTEWVYIKHYFIK